MVSRFLLFHYFLLVHTLYVAFSVFALVYLASKKAGFVQMEKALIAIEGLGIPLALPSASL